jgi:LeuA allosteric (dimerisation) domain.
VENIALHETGLVDATVNAVEKSTNTEFEFKLYHVNAITDATDAQGEVTVRLEDDNLTSQAKVSDPDIIVAFAKEYINALNRLIFKKTKSTKENTANFKIEGV